MRTKKNLNVASPLGEALAARRREREAAQKSAADCLVAAATIVGVLDACADPLTALALLRHAQPLLADGALLAESRQQEQAELDKYAKAIGGHGAV